jgi:hypothetical protein|nr:MAG TPA: hypothetical protein [Caudoviricetes sp.]
MAITANTTVIVGGRAYKAGQTIPSLSAIDKEWMKKANYIAETTNKKEDKKAATVEESKDEL